MALRQPYALTNGKKTFRRVSVTVEHVRGPGWFGEEEMLVYYFGPNVEPEEEHLARFQGTKIDAAARLKPEAWRDDVPR